MAAGGKRAGAGERILEGRHVIALCLAMMVLSGIFFALGFEMGRNELDARVRAATDPRTMPDPSVLPRTDMAPKRAKNAPPAPVDAPPTDGTATSSPEWEFYHAGEAKKTDDVLKPAAKTVPAVAKNGTSPKAANASAKNVNAPLIPSGSYTLQVAALTKQAVALDLANRLQKKNFPAFVLSPQADKYYRVQVGPYADQKSAEAAKKGLDAAGFKAIVKH
jgi:cell division septation protein DedD